MNFLLIAIGCFIGLIIGQLSVFRRLRKKGKIIIGDWMYRANEIEKGG